MISKTTGCSDKEMLVSNGTIASRVICKPSGSSIFNSTQADSSPHQCGSIVSLRESTSSARNASC